MKAAQLQMRVSESTSLTKQLELFEDANKTFLIYHQGVHDLYEGDDEITNEQYESGLEEQHIVVDVLKEEAMIECQAATVAFRRLDGPLESQENCAANGYDSSMNPQVHVLKEFHRAQAPGIVWYCAELEITD